MISLNVKSSRSPGQSGGTPGGTRQEPIKERFKKMVSEFITTELSSHYKKAKESQKMLHLDHTFLHLFRNRGISLYMMIPLPKPHLELPPPRQSLSHLNFPFRVSSTG